MLMYDVRRDVLAEDVGKFSEKSVGSMIDFHKCWNSLTACALLSVAAVTASFSESDFFADLMSVLTSLLLLLLFMLYVKSSLLPLCAAGVLFLLSSASPAVC